MYDQLDDVINSLSLKYRINKSLTISSIDHIFNQIKEKMGDEDLPNVLVHNWGRFKPNIKYLRYKVKNLYKYINENNPRQEHFERLRRYIKAYKRLCKEEEVEFTEEFIEIESFIKQKFNEESK